jgi:hypothetical protein
MNQQNAREYMPLVQALANGLIIQEDFFGEWSDLSDEISFNMKPEFYRIKPEPRRWSMVRCLNNGYIYQDTGTDGFDSKVWERITVVEVLK